MAQAGLSQGPLYKWKEHSLKFHLKNVELSSTWFVSCWAFSDEFQFLAARSRAQKAYY